MQQLLTFFPASISTLLGGAALLLSLGVPGQALGQCTTCTYTVGNPNKSDSFNLIGGETLTIGTNVNFDGTINVLGNGVTVVNMGSITKGGSVVVRGNNTVIRNEGDLDNGSKGGGTGGFLTVVSGATGTVLHNLGTVASQNVKLNAPTTVNNGSAASSAAVWSGYVDMNFTAAAITINNYGSWSGQLNDLPSGTVNNFGTGTWSAYFKPSGTSVINNSGTWNATDLNYSGSLALNHTGGTWTANLNPGGALALTNSATWTKGFNFPGAGPNRLVNTGTATFGSYLGLGAATTIINSGAMTMTQGMSDISANSSLTNQRGATFRVIGQLVNYGTVSNAGTVASSGNFMNQAGATMSGPAAPLRGSFTANGYAVNAGSFGMVGRLDFCNGGNSGFSSQTGSLNAGTTTICSLRPLPVELAAFTAEVVKGRVQLRWTTASEHNSAVFVVERSAGGEAYQAVREVAAQGNSTSATVYAAADAQPLPGTSYYRLRQVDRDGAVAYSPVANVSVAASALPIAAYPNPATDRLTLDLTAVAAAEPCTVQVLSLAGQAVRTEQLAGGRVQELSLADLPAGLYVLQVHTARGNTAQRLAKQ